MKANQNQPAAAELRRRAEERLQRQRPAGEGPRTELETARLVHELQVHQLELEMQNEELQQAHANIEVLLAQYAELYDFAPTGYFTLAADGTIRAVNLTGARLLGIERGRLLDRRFGVLVSPADRLAFNAFLAKTFAGESREYCEVALLRAETEPFFVRVEAVVSEGRRECRAVVLDVTDRHQIEADRDQLIQDLQQALAKVKSLSGLLPICAGCKQIRDDQGYWSQVESYIQKHSEATFTHGLCPDCIKQHYRKLDHPDAGPTPLGGPAKQMPPEQLQA